MHADLSRSTFRPERHYSAVIAQQGRVQLDADANEQTAIELHRARTLAADLIGRHGGPRDAAGFRIQYVGGKHDIDTLNIYGGRYYVDGILCDADRPAPGVPVPDEDAADDDVEAVAPPAFWTYWDQPDGFRDPEKPGDRLPSPAQAPFVVYLSVWERSVTAAEDPALREVALGSAMPDTAARSKVVWQVLPLTLAALGVEETDPTKEQVSAKFLQWARDQSAPSANLAARAQRPDHADEDPCLVKPDARFRGPENQLYRVEVHAGGPAADATFKWSRENGSVVFPVDELDGTWVRLASLGQDDKLDLDVGDQVEFSDTAYASRLEALPCFGSRSWTCRAAGCGCPPSRSPVSDGCRTCTRSCVAGTTRRAPSARAARQDCGTGRSASRRASGCPSRTVSRCTSPRAALTAPATTGSSRPAPRLAASSGP